MPFDHRTAVTNAGSRSRVCSIRCCRSTLEAFLSDVRSDMYALPRHVENELRDYLRCGVLAHGFVRVRCNDCGQSKAVGFSCKGRGFCPSCTGRRMADTSARLVDDTFPEHVPVRQWVLSLPIQIRYRLAYDGKLLSEVLGVFNPKSGRFHEAPPLQDDDVKAIVETTARRVVRLLERRGILGMGEFDDFAEEQPVLAGMTNASILGLVAIGDRRGMPVRRVLQYPADLLAARVSKRRHISVRYNLDEACICAEPSRGYCREKHSPRGRCGDDRRHRGRREPAVAG